MGNGVNRFPNGFIFNTYLIDHDLLQSRAVIAQPFLIQGLNSDCYVFCWNAKDFQLIDCQFFYQLYPAERIRFCPSFF